MFYDIKGGIKVIVIAKELLQYEKDYVNYYINIPKLYYKEKNESNYLQNEMIEKINQLISEDILTFMEVVDDSNNSISNECTLINSLTEFEIGYISNNIISLAIEFSQLWGLSDISYIKGYNYDFDLKKEIHLENLFKKNVDFLEILKKYIIVQVKKIFNELELYEEDEVDYLKEDNIILDEDNTFYFTHEFLILPFSSCEIKEDILNLMEVKIPFNKIYPYLNEYAIKNIVKKIIL